jgi:predicted DsbA family dithiol-disulfide isomerase
MSMDETSTTAVTPLLTLGDADAVHADIEEARRLGANGVPFFVIDRRYGISGAQPAETFLQALRTAYAGDAAAAR